MQRKFEFIRLNGSDLGPWGIRNDFSGEDARRMHEGTAQKIYVPVGGERCKSLNGGNKLRRAWVAAFGNSLTLFLINCHCFCYTKIMLHLHTDPLRITVCCNEFCSFLISYSNDYHYFLRKRYVSVYFLAKLILKVNLFSKNRFSFLKMQLTIFLFYLIWWVRQTYNLWVFWHTRMSK